MLQDAKINLQDTLNTEIHTQLKNLNKYTHHNYVLDPKDMFNISTDLTYEFLEKLAEHTYIIIHSVFVRVDHHLNYRRATLTVEYYSDCHIGLASITIGPLVIS